jgi:hypothetical protein
LATGNTQDSDILKFAERERAFLKTLSQGSTDELASFLRTDFILFDEATSDSTAKANQPPGFLASSIKRPPLSSDYVRFLHDRSAGPYHERSTYRLYRVGTHATVVTYPPDGKPFLTGWDSAAAGWQVASVTINLSRQRTASIEEMLKHMSAEALRRVGQARQ